MDSKKDDLKNLKKEVNEKFLSWGRVKKFGKSPLSITIGSCTLVGITLVAFRIYVQFVIPITIVFIINNGPVGLPDSTISGSSTSIRPQDVKTREGEQNKIVGHECLSVDKSVPCDTMHDAEVIVSDSSCGSEVLINYLDGKPMVDTISPGISYEPSSDNSVCKIKFPILLQDSIEGKWKEPSSHQLPELRSCFNPDRVDQVVGCNEPHTGEVVYSRSGGDGTNLSCDEKAVDYMDSDKEKWQDTLKTEEVEYNGSWLCVAKTRNNNLLDSTLRSLRTRKIETKPRQ